MLPAASRARWRWRVGRGARRWGGGPRGAAEQAGVALGAMGAPGRTGRELASGVSASSGGSGCPSDGELQEGGQGGNFHEAPCSANGEGLRGIRLWGEHAGRLGRAGARAPGARWLPNTNWPVPSGPQPPGTGPAPRQTALNWASRPPDWARRDCPAPSSAVTGPPWLRVGTFPTMLATPAQPLRQRGGPCCQSCSFFPAQPLQPPGSFRAMGRWVGAVIPLGIAGQGMCLAAGVPGPGSAGGAGGLAACRRGLAGAVFLCLLGRGDGQRCGSRPASPGQPIVSQLGGEGEGQLPQGFPTVEGATTAALPGLKQCQAQPTQAQGWVMLAVTQGCPPGPRHPAVPGCPWLGRLPPTSHRCRSWGTPVLGDMAALVPSTSRSFCASPAESFSLAGHERAFIPSPPRGRITPGGTLCRCLAPGLPVTPAWVGAQHDHAGASCGELEQTPATPGLHETYLLLDQLRNDCPPRPRTERRHGCGHVCFWPGYLYLLNKDATVIWAKRRPRSSPAHRSPAPQPSAAQALGSAPGPPGAPPATAMFVTACWGGRV